MSAPTTRRAVAEIDFGEGQAAPFKIGNRSIHQFWHLFSAHFRNVLLAPQRRPDSGRVAWTWREAVDKPPVTAAELAEVRRRLTEANRSLDDGFGNLARSHQAPGGGATLEGQVRGNVREMVNQLIAHRDLALNGFVCRTDAGLLLHSWGAPAAARPYYPDVQAGEISGTVLTGAERSVGITVVLENIQGLGLARVKTDKDGEFLFSKVNAGNYRVRVADRSDFPDGGLTVTLERDSITGLELRSVSPEINSRVSTSHPAPDRSVAWYRRPLFTVGGLLLLAGLGSCVWLTTQKQNSKSEVKRQSTGWQSASGQLSANGASENSSADDRKVGEEAGFSSLSSSVAPPKLLTPKITRTPSDAKGSPVDRSPAPPEDSERSEKKPVLGEKKSASGSTDRSSAHVASPKQNSPTESRRPGSNEKERAAEDFPQAAAGNEPEEPRTKENKLAKTSREAAIKKHPEAMGNSSAVDDAASETPLASGEKKSTNSPSSATPAASASKTRSAAMTKSAAGTALNPSSETAGNPPDSGTPNDPASSANNGSSNQLKSSPGKKNKEATNASAGNGPSTATDESPSATASDNAKDESIPLAAANKGAAKAVSPKKNPSGQAPTQARPAEPPAQENPESMPSPVAATSAQKTAKQSPPNTAPPLTPAGKKETPTALASEAAADSSVAVPPANASGGTSPQPRAKTAKNNKAAAVSTPPPAEDPSTDALVNSAPATTEAAIPSGGPVPDKNGEPLVAVGRVSASPWRPRLMQDLILPTRPLAVGEEEGLEDMRQKLLREKNNRMPKTFRQPEVRSGFVLEWDGNADAKGPLPHWRNDTGTEPANSRVDAHQAELSWSGTKPPPEEHYTLNYPDGRTIAEVKVDQSGVPRLKVFANTRAWYWMGIESLAGDPGSHDSGQPRKSFDWQLLSGAALPASWRRDDHWLADRGQRLDIPLDSSTKRAGNYGVALVDLSTGWALTNDVAIQAP